MEISEQNEMIQSFINKNRFNDMYKPIATLEYDNSEIEKIQIVYNDSESDTPFFGCPTETPRSKSFTHRDRKDSLENLD